MYHKATRGDDFFEWVDCYLHTISTGVSLTTVTGSERERSERGVREEERRGGRGGERGERWERRAERVTERREERQRGRGER